MVAQKNLLAIVCMSENYQKCFLIELSIFAQMYSTLHIPNTLYSMDAYLESTFPVVMCFVNCLLKYLLLFN